jgi:hypothetical protein
MSSTVSGGAARATSSPQEQLSIGRALLQQKKYTDASEALSLALEMFVQAFGEVGAECAEVYATRNLCAKRLRAKRLPTAVPVAKDAALCALSTCDSCACLVRRYYFYGLSQFREEEVSEELRAESFFAGDIVCLRVFRV